MACIADEQAGLAVHQSVGTGKTGDIHAKIDRQADEVESEVIAWRHDLHQHPELSNRETRTAAKIADHLTSLGLEVRTGIGTTGVVGILRGGAQGDRTIALRADMDALPVEEVVDVPFKSTVVDNEYPGGPFPVAHACGHDGHVAMLMGAASVLSALKDDVAGTVMFVFQPSEEGPPAGEPFGAQAMVDAGVFDDPKPDTVFGMHISPHPVGTINYASGLELGASAIFTIVIHGKQVHGSTPFLGLDPMPVLSAIDNGFAQIYRQINTNEPMTISIGKIDTVGRTNIIGETITAAGTIRSGKSEVMEDMISRMTRVVDHAAQMHGLTADIQFDQKVPALINDPAWLKRVLPSLERVAGAENMHVMQPVMGYDDVSVMVNEIGGVYAILGGQNTKFEDGGLKPTDPSSPTGGLVPNHNPAFYFMDEALKTGVRAHAHVAIDFLNGA